MNSHDEAQRATYLLVLPGTNLRGRTPDIRSVLDLPDEWWDDGHRLRLNLDEEPRELNLPSCLCLPGAELLQPIWVETEYDPTRPSTHIAEVQDELKRAGWAFLLRSLDPDLAAKYEAGTIPLNELAPDKETFKTLLKWTPYDRHEEWVDPPKPHGIIKAAAVLDRFKQPDDWIAYPVLERGYASMIVGAGGTGKSVWTLGLMLHVAAGREKFGPIVLRQAGPVLYIHCDERMDKMVKRVEAARQFYDIHEDVPLYTYEPKKLKLGEGTVLVQEIAAFCKEYKPVAVVFDPLVNFEGGDENSANSMAQVARTIVELANAHNFAAWLVHHPPKGDVDAMDPNAARGSSALPGSMRVVTFLDRRNDCSLSLYQSKFSNSAGMKASAWRFATVELTSTGETYPVIESLDIEPTTWEHKGDLLELVAQGRADGIPWACAKNAPKASRLDVAVDERWGAGVAEQVLPAYEAAGLIERGVVEVPKKPKGKQAIQAWIVRGVRVLE